MVQVDKPTVCTQVREGRGAKVTRGNGTHKLQRKGPPRRGRFGWKPFPRLCAKNLLLHSGRSGRATSHPAMLQRFHVMDARSLRPAALAQLLAVLLLLWVCLAPVSTSSGATQATQATKFSLTARGESVLGMPRRARRGDDTLSMEHDELRLAFDVGSVHFEYDLCRSAGVFNAETVITTPGNTGSPARRHIEPWSRPPSYTSCGSDHGLVAIITLLDASTVAGVVGRGASLFEIRSGSTPGSLAVAKSEGLSTHMGCGNTDSDDPPRHARAADRQRQRRRRAAVDPGNATRWTDCYPNDETTHQVPTFKSSCCVYVCVCVCVMCRVRRVCAHCAMLRCACV